MVATTSVLGYTILKTTYGSQKPILKEQVVQALLVFQLPDELLLRPVPAALITMMTLMNGSLINLIIQMIKKYWVYILFGIAVVFYVITGWLQDNPKGADKIPEVTHKTFYSDSLHWGYDIYVNNALRYHQPIIPGASGKQGCVS
jgi:hypothetical protein